MSTLLIALTYLVSLSERLIGEIPAGVTSRVILQNSTIPMAVLGRNSAKYRLAVAIYADIAGMHSIYIHTYSRHSWVISWQPLVVAIMVAGQF